MIMLNKHFRRPSRVQWAVTSLFVALAALGYLALFKMSGGVTVSSSRLSWLCVVYAGVISLFLLAQMVAFVASHAHYSESVEEPKFQLIERELQEWKNFPN